MVIYVVYLSDFSEIYIKNILQKKSCINLLKKINANTFDHHKNSKSLKTGFDLIKSQHGRLLCI